MKFKRFIIMTLAMTSFPVMANDYPTLERVDSVLTCMKKHGGQTVENLYACSCKIDVIASKVPFDIWNEARTYQIYKRMPGEKGGLFRDSERAEEVVPMLEAAEKEGEKRCFFGAKNRRKAQAKADK